MENYSAYHWAMKAKAFAEAGGIEEVSEGCIRLSSGVQIAYGRGTVQSTGTAITFQKPFVNASYSIVLSGNSSCEYSGVTAEGFTATSTISESDMSYIAIGSWKEA